MESFRLLVGLYTGGTPNLAAIGAALNVDANTFILTHTYDMVIGGICLLFLMTLARSCSTHFLPSFEAKHARYSEEMEIDHREDIDSFMKILSKSGIIQVLKAFGFSSVIVSIGGGLSLLVPEKHADGNGDFVHYHPGNFIQQLEFGESPRKLIPAGHVFILCFHW